MPRWSGWVQTHLDLLLAHVWDDNVPLEKTLAALEFPVSSGRVRYTGVSNYNGWQLVRAATLCEVPLVANQVEYSLMARDIERVIMPAAEHVGAGVMSWAPLGRGVLTGKYSSHVPADSRAAGETMAGYVQKYLADRPARITEAVFNGSQRFGGTPLDVALNWLLEHQEVSTAVVGPHTQAQLQDVLAASLAPSPEQSLSALSEVSRSP